MPVRSNDAFVARERPACAEIEGGSPKIRDPSAGLLHDQRACRLIPDGVAKVRWGREPEQQVGLARRNRRVLGLAVHQHRRNLDGQCSKGSVEAIDADVVILDRSNHAGQARFATRRHMERSEPVSRERRAKCAAIPHGEHDRTRQQFGAAKYADLHLTAHDEGQCDNVLPATKEPFRAIDRVERPEPSACRSGPAIDGVKHFVCSKTRHDLLNRNDHRLEDRALFRRPQRCGSLLRHEAIAWKLVRKTPRDDSLHGEIGYRHWRSIGLEQQAVADLAAHVARQNGRVPDRTECHVELVLPGLEIHYCNLVQSPVARSAAMPEIRHHFLGYWFAAVSIEAMRLQFPEKQVLCNFQQPSHSVAFHHT
jgi:hypothetical protein